MATIRNVGGTTKYSDKSKMVSVQVKWENPKEHEQTIYAVKRQVEDSLRKRLSSYNMLISRGDEYDVVVFVSGYVLSNGRRDVRFYLANKGGILKAVANTTARRREQLFMRDNHMEEAIDDILPKLSESLATSL